MNSLQVAITIVAALVLAGAAVGVFALGGDGSNPTVTQAPTTVINLASPTPAAKDAPPASTAAPPTPLPVPATAEPDRSSCDEIRGTPYRSESERRFFLDNCVTQPVTEQQPALATGEPETVESASCSTNVEIDVARNDVTYFVAGTNLNEIADSLATSAPQLDGAPAYGLTEYSYGLSGSFCQASASSPCSIGQLTISADVEVTLPLLTTLDQLPSQSAELWTEYADAVAIHEGRHVRILEDGLAEIRRQLLLIGEEPSCDELNHEIDKVWTLGGGQMEQRQRAFHIADASGSGGLVVQ